MTKKLLNKELRLSASPLSLVFLVFSAMTLIPGYPILLGAWFVSLGLFYSFQNLRETNDILYTVLLPLPKGEVVRGKYAFVCLMQGISFGLMAFLTVLRMTVLSEVPAYVHNIMMPANPVFLAFALLVFLSFNLLFLEGLFRTAFAIGRPFVSFLAAAIVLMALGETLHHIPGLKWLGSYDGADLGGQLIVLAAVAALYVFGTLSSYRRSRRRFESLDL